MIGAGPVLNWMAGEGLKPFEKKIGTVKLVGNFYILSIWLAALDPKLKSGKDLIGKRIGLGHAVRINMSVEPEWIIRHGWGIGDQVTIEHLGSKAL